MNIEQAKAIPLTDILHRLGYSPSWQRGHRVRYSSPLRQERTPSFDVRPESNVWYDHGAGQGGNVLDFAVAYLQSQGRSASVSDGLGFLDGLMGQSYVPLPVKEKRPLSKADPQTDRVLEITSLLGVRHPALVQYLQQRGLDVDIARLYLKQADVRNRQTGKRFFALAFGNEDGGYELRTPYFKSAVSPKAITFVRGTVPKPDGIHVFEGWPDFLTVLTRERTERLKFDSIVLNSLSMGQQATAFMKGYGYRQLFTWMDNDASGEKAARKFAEMARAEEQMATYRMNRLYQPHKDVNEWHMHDLGLPPLQL